MTIWHEREKVMLDRLYDQFKEAGFYDVWNPIETVSELKIGLPEGWYVRVDARFGTSFYSTAPDEPDGFNVGYMSNHSLRKGKFRVSAFPERAFIYPVKKATKRHINAFRLICMNCHEGNVVINHGLPPCNCGRRISPFVAQALRIEVG